MKKVINHYTSTNHFPMLKSLRPFILANTFLFVATCALSARPMRNWSNQALLDTSDLVVIASPTGVATIREGTKLPGMSGVSVIGVETKFAVSAVVKGDGAIKDLVLHHYNLAEADKSPPNGPMLVAFEPAKKQSFLLYLVREADGRYAPATGQIDPGFQAVQAIKEAMPNAVVPIPKSGPASELTPSDVRATNGATPSRYSFSIVHVYESPRSQPEWVFILGGTGSLQGGVTVCKSVASLKKLLKGLPRGSVVDWSPTCDGESAVLEGDIQEVKNICSEAGVTFTIHPTG